MKLTNIAFGIIFLSVFSTKGFAGAAPLISFEKCDNLKVSFIDKVKQAEQCQIKLQNVIASMPTLTEKCDATGPKSFNLRTQKATEIGELVKECRDGIDDVKAKYKTVFTPFIQHIAPEHTACRDQLKNNIENIDARVKPDIKNYYYYLDRICGKNPGARP